MERGHLLTLVAGFGLLVGTAQAVPTLVFDGGGKVIGIHSLNVNGTDYDVAFSNNESFNAANAAFGPGVDWVTAAAADIAKQAIESFLNGPPVTPAADMAWGTGSNSDDQDILVWYALSALDVTFTYVDWDQFSGVWNDNTATGTVLRTASSVNDANYAWAFFSPSSAVPEPASLALLGLGLAGLAAIRRKRI